MYYRGMRCPDRLSIHAPSDDDKLWLAEIDIIREREVEGW